jgi:hypothetical protein
MKKVKSARVSKSPHKILEAAGCMVESNYWLQIGLTRRELALVKRLAKDYKFKRTPSASMARHLVIMALVNLPILDRSWRAMVNYCEAEGINVESYRLARARQVLDSL